MENQEEKSPASSAVEAPEVELAESPGQPVLQVTASGRLTRGDKRVAKLMRIVRRTHLYLGLFMFPWIVLFGITAISFNHPGMARTLEGRRYAPADFQAMTGITPWQADEIATGVLEKMAKPDAATSEAALGGYQLVPDSAVFHGWALFASPGERGQHVAIVALNQGAGIISHRPAPEESEVAPFSGRELRLEKYNSQAIANALTPLKEKLNLDAKGPFRPHPEVHPEVRFQAKDKEGRSWNLVYDLTSGLLDGRPSEEAAKGETIELLESLHTQHHFPPTLGATTFWALMADLTALTLLLWAVTGLIMWWQMKKLRAVGVAVLAFGLTIAAIVMTSTAQDLQFGPARAAQK